MQSIAYNMYDFFWAVFQTACIVGAVFAVFVGIWALFLPASFMKFCKRLDYSVHSPASKIEILDRPRFIEWYIYRHHEVIGAVMVIVGTFVMYKSVMTMDYHGLRKMVNSLFHDLWPAVMIEITVGVIYLSAFLGIIVGLILLMRPSLLKGIERLSNHWIAAGDMMTHQMEKQFHLPDRWVEKHPRLFGLLDLVGALLVIIVMWEAL